MVKINGSDRKEGKRWEKTNTGGLGKMEVIKKGAGIREKITTASDGTEKSGQTRESRVRGDRLRKAKRQKGGVKEKLARGGG